MCVSLSGDFVVSVVMIAMHFPATTTIGDVMQNGALCAVDSS